VISPSFTVKLLYATDRDFYLSVFQAKAALIPLKKKADSKSIIKCDWAGLI